MKHGKHYELLLWEEVLAYRLQVPLYLEIQRVHNTRGANLAQASIFRELFLGLTLRYMWSPALNSLGVLFWSA
jgi:hypothetical protein